MAASQQSSQFHAHLVMIISFISNIIDALICHTVQAEHLDTSCKVMADIINICLLFITRIYVFHSAANIMIISLFITDIQYVFNMNLTIVFMLN